MIWMFLTLLLAQGIAMLVDEFYFHHQRGLKTWESFGHPLDTLTVIGVFSLPLWLQPSLAASQIFAGAAIFSSVFVTKDEFIHKHQCPAAEQWLHALLFLLHPALFFLLYFVWTQHPNKKLFLGFSLKQFLVAHLLTLTLFMVYQLVFWQGGKRFAKQYSN